MICCADIKVAVAREYRVPLRIMDQPDGVGSRMPSHVRPRQIAMVLATRLTEHSRIKGGRAGQKIHNTMRRVTFALISSTYPQGIYLLRRSPKSKS